MKEQMQGLKARVKSSYTTRIQFDIHGLVTHRGGGGLGGH